MNLALLANNHICDYGLPGIESTIQALDNAGVAQIGAGVDKIEASAPYIIDLPDNCRRSKLTVLNYAEEEFGAIDTYSASGYNPVCISRR